MLALDAYEAGVCSGCGTHSDLANDPRLTFSPVEETCPNCEGLARWHRLRDKQDDATRKETGADKDTTLPDPADGRKIRLQIKPVARLDR